jgi:hypothetical protein
VCPVQQEFFRRGALATIAVIAPMLEGGHTMAAPVCRGCNGDGEETERRVKAVFGIIDLQQGRA